MKHSLRSFILFLGTSFFLSGLQGHLHFLPLPIPHFWFIIMTYYAFKKGLFFSLITNFSHSFIICSFTSIFIGLLLILINSLTFLFIIIDEQFRIKNKHITLAAGIGCFCFLFFKWCLQSLNYGFSYPQFFQWISTRLMTLVVAPPILFVFDKIDKKIQMDSEQVELLKNLRTQ